MSFSNLWTIPLIRDITVLSNDGGVEEKLIRLRRGGGVGVRPNELTQFPLKTMSLFILLETNTIFINMIFSMFSCMSFVDVPMMLSTY